MNFWQGKICPVCHKEFTETDDVVYCPECGTAQHRACWKENGNACFFADEHAAGNFDTANEVSAPPPVAAAVDAPAGEDAEGPKRIVCPNCGYSNLPFYRVCLNCGTDLTQTHGYAAPPDGQPDSNAAVEGEAEPDVSNRELADYCGPSALKYLDRFERVRRNQTAFNPAAFIFSFFWMLYRKMIGVGLAIAAAVMAPILVLYGSLYYNCADALYQALMNSDTESYYATVSAFLTQHATMATLCNWLFWTLLLGGMFFCGFLSSKLYYQKALRDIRSIKLRTADRAQQAFIVAYKGGVNILLPMLVIVLNMLLSSLLSQIISLFFLSA